jgi:NhaP-type Na+/H+ or K+/H+ antiporter
MSFAILSLITGAILIAMALVWSLVERLPLSPGVLYLALGYALGPAGWDVIALDPIRHSVELERLTEIALLISLFAVGLKLGIPLTDKRWLTPLRLAFPSMTLTVLFITPLAMTLCGLPLAAATLLAAILAPTDPVLASDVQVADSSDRDRLRFSLTAEGGLNDGTAFPFVLLGLAMLGFYDFGLASWRWLGIDVLWSIAGGLGLGGASGAAIGKLVIYLRTRHQEAVGVDEFPVARIDRNRVRRRGALPRLGLSRGLRSGSLRCRESRRPRMLPCPLSPRRLKLFSTPRPRRRSPPTRSLPART